MSMQAFHKGRWTIALVPGTLARKDPGREEGAASEL